MHELIAKDRRNAERIFPYIGGEEVSDSPSHTHHRCIIDFDDWPLHRSETRTLWRDANDRERATMLSLGVVPKDYPNNVAADWPHLISIVEAKVKADRMGFAFLPTGMVYSEQLVVFATSDVSIYAMCQSRCHESWARFFASSMKDDMRYTPSDCFETFPFPAGVLAHAAGDSPTADNGPLTTLETAGREFLLDYEDDEDEDDTSPTRERVNAGTHSLALRARTRKTRGATAGPTPSATKSSPACWNSTNNAPNKNASPDSPIQARSASE